MAYIIPYMCMQGCSFVVFTVNCSPTKSSSSKYHWQNLYKVCIKWRAAQQDKSVTHLVRKAHEYLMGWQTLKTVESRYVLKYTVLYSPGNDIKGMLHLYCTIRGIMCIMYVCCEPGHSISTYWSVEIFHHQKSISKIVYRQAHRYRHHVNILKRNMAYTNCQFH